MKRIILLISLIIISVFPLLSSAQPIAHEKLVFAIDVIRHGDRTPTKEIPNDPHKWPQGLGALTPLGMQQEYQLGTSFRKFYITETHLLPAHFEIDSMQVFSDTCERTIQSALSVLYGLYPLGSGPKIANHFALPSGYQPIPIFTTMQFGKNSITAPALKTYHTLLQQQVYASPAWQKQQQAWQAQFATISKITGFKIDTIYQLITVGQNLLIRKIHHVAYPMGLSAANAEKLSSLSSRLIAERYAPRSIGSIVSSPLLTKIKTYMIDAAQQKLPLKFVLFSAHDTTILALMSALNMPLQQQPPYASDVKFLLYKNAQNIFLIKMFYNNTMLKLPFCHNHVECPVNEFFKSALQT